MVRRSKRRDAHIAFRNAHVRQSTLGLFESNINRHVHAVRLGASQPLGLSISALIQVLSSLGLAFRTDWKLALVVLSIVPVMSIGISLLSHPLQKYVESHGEKLTAATRLANKFISNIVLVKCFNTQDQERGSHAMAIKEAALLCYKASFFKALQRGFVRFISTVMFLQGKYPKAGLYRNLAYGVISGFWYGGTQIHSGKTTTGSVITTFWACLIAAKGFEDMLPHILVLHHGQNAARALLSVLVIISRGRTQIFKVDGLSPQFCEGSIEMQSVGDHFTSTNED